MDGTLADRAAMHHALGDPSRLAVVDALAFGEASPTELQTLLAMPSNLLAHHVRVLEQAGIVRRTRSEGDRRRTYLGLVAGALDTLHPAVTREAPRVVFVCTRNSARSQLAAALWNAGSAVPATSAGTAPAPAVHPGAVDAARRHHVPLRAGTPRRAADVLRPDDLVITVCDRAHEELGVPATHWSVPDPARTGDDITFAPAAFDPAAFDPAAFDPAAFDPAAFDPAAFDPAAFDPAAFDRALTDLAARISRLAPAVLPSGTRSA